MKHLKLHCIILAAVFAALSCVDASAQFRSEAFSQQYNDDNAADTDSTEVLFSLKDYFAGLRHEKEIGIGTLCGGSAVLIGGCQIYNHQAWKLPIVYGTIGGSLGAGLYLNSKGNTKAATWCFAGAGLAYWATMMDGVINYRPNDYPHPGTATLYSILLPGLGQIYNHDYWKLPVYLGAIGFAFHYYSDCQTNYLRFRNIYLQANDPDVEYTGPISGEQALYYRNVYRRYRDYSVLAIAVLYLLQVIDANVFAYMHNFEVDDDIAFRVSPTIIAPQLQFASNNPVSQQAAFGLRLGLSF